MPACACPAAGPQPEITHLAWNRKVQHILGTCTAAGTVVVWDLKKQRPVISFKDPSGWVGLGVGRNTKIGGWCSWLSCRSYLPCHAWESIFRLCAASLAVPPTIRQTC